MGFNPVLFYYNFCPLLDRSAVWHMLIFLHFILGLIKHVLHVFIQGHIDVNVGSTLN
jgi:hypothetical protein